MAVQQLDPAKTAQPPRSPAPGVDWSVEQLARLDAERRLLRRRFAYHPHVRITAIAREPPAAEYDVEFRTQTLCVGESGQLEFADCAAVRIWLPPEFPQSAPRARPLRGLFHPNISGEGIHLSNGWRATDTLADFVQRLGELLAWRAYDPQGVVNAAALQWLDLNAPLLPLDRVSDFGFEAGGPPLSRIEQNAQQELIDVARRLEAFRQTMLSEAAPGLLEVERSVRGARGRLEPLIEPDVPAAIREPAAQLDLWLQDLPAMVPAWEAIRAHRATVQALRDATAALADQREALREQSRIGEIRAMLQDVRDRADQLAIAPVECPPAEDTPLGRQIRAEARAAAVMARVVRRAAAAVAAEVEPLLAEANEAVGKSSSLLLNPSPV